MSYIILAPESANPWNIIPHIANPYSLSAFALAVILFIVLKRTRGKVPGIAWGLIILIVIIPIAVSAYIEISKGNGNDGIYRVRITVIDSQRVPVEDAKVWSTFGGEAKKVAAGWQFDIPQASKPQDGKLTIFATRESAFLKGEAQLQLAGDYNPGVTIQLKRDASAKVRGQVVDSQGRAVEGARVWVVGYGDEGVTTKSDGSFVLPAHAAAGQQVQLHAERQGYKAKDQYHPAGDEPAVLTLER